MKKLISVSIALLFASLAWGQSLTPALNTITSSGSTCATWNNASGVCDIAQLPTGQATTAAITLAGTWVGTVQFEVSGDNQNTWFSATCNPTPSGLAVSSATTNGTWVCNVQSMSFVRARASAWTSGIAVTMIAPSIAAPGALGTSAATYLSTVCGGQAACPNATDESVAIQAAVTSSGCAKFGGCHIVDDLCGIQTWSVQPFSGAANNLMNGLFEFRNNCPASNPHIISVDGMSTVLVPTGLWVVGQGTAQAALTPQYGSVGNLLSGTYIRACNPAIYPCLHGGFIIQSGTITSTGAPAANLSLVTMVGKPFSTANTVNAIGQYRMITISGATGANAVNNAAWMINDCNTTGCASTPQTFHIAVTTGFATCASACGTAYFDTPLINIGSGAGNGTFGSRIDNLTIDCSYMIGCGGWVQAAGQEMTGLGTINSWNSTVYGGRIDESPAYNGAAAGATNSGPYGPLSTNVISITCGLNGGCACRGGSSGCSSGVIGTPGTVPLGTTMSCGAGTAQATIDVGGVDPCVNSNMRGFLFTGTVGQQGAGRVYGHATCTINDKSASGGLPVPELWGATPSGQVYGQGGISGTPGTYGACFAVYGTHVEIDDTHTEYYPTGYDVAGDANRSATFYFVYTASTASPLSRTSGVSFDGGFGSACGATATCPGTGSAIMADIGSQPSDANAIGDVEFRNVNMMNGDGALDIQDNVYGRKCFSFSSAPGSDYVMSYSIGHTTTVAQTNNGQTGLATPQLRTTCTGLPHFIGNAFGFPIISTSAIAVFGVPVKWDTAAANQVKPTITTDTGAGVVVGVSYASAAAGGYASVVTTGEVPMLFDTAGTGTCAIGNFVIVGTLTAGHVQCTATYTAGTVIGTAMQAMNTTNTPFNVLVGLR